MSELWSAQVLLNAGHADAEEVRRFFASRGFDVGPVRAGSFPISAVAAVVFSGPPDFAPSNP